jgi:hypothetical protein
MLIRVGGGKAGIKEYLEHAAKQGRLLGRDQLDERVVLAGDLDLTHAIIESMASPGERYLHVTLALKEDYVERTTLTGLVSQFEQFALCAYEKTEYCFYAEAHLPRLKSYTNSLTGESVARKPHIHIIVPKVNLLSGGPLNPFGLVKRHIRFIDAFQEHMNLSLGLASPKANRRAGFTSESEMIARFSGEVLGGTGKELKGEILKGLLLEPAQAYEEFKVWLARFGEVRTRNAGGGSEYQNIKVAGAKKGINLKEYVFGRDFVGLAIADKRQFVESKTDMSMSYDTVGALAVPPETMVDTLKEWREVRAREVRWLNSGHRKAWREYHELDRSGRSGWLDERSKRFYAAYEVENTEARSIDAETATTDSHAIEEIMTSNRVRLPDRTGETKEAPDFPVSGAFDPREASQHTSVDAAVSPVPVGRSAKRLLATGRAADSVVSQVLRDAREYQQIESVSADFSEIKARLDPVRLLAEVSQSHGVVVGKYRVFQVPDGSSRIECGSRHLNVSDFLTKELRLAWSDAAKILQESYAAQQRGEPTPPSPQDPRPSLWIEFSVERKLRTQHIKAADREVRRVGADERMHLKAGFRARTRLVQGNRSLSPTQRKAALLEVRTERLATEAELRRRLLNERSQLKEVRPVREQYRDFLRHQAQAGDDRALAELRRQRVVRVASDRLAYGEFRCATGTKLQRNSVICRAEGVTARVAADGSVTYERGGVPILCDSDGALQVLRDDEATVRTALVFARQIFGNALTVSGPASFQNASRIAASEMLIELDGPTIGVILPVRTPIAADGEHELEAHWPEDSDWHECESAGQLGDTLTAGEELDESLLEELLRLLLRLDAALPNGDPRREDWWSLGTIDNSHLMDGSSVESWTRVSQFLRVQPVVVLAMYTEITNRITQLEDMEQPDDHYPRM